MPTTHSELILQGLIASSSFYLQSAKEAHQGYRNTILRSI